LSAGSNMTMWPRCDFVVNAGSTNRTLRVARKIG
jgi:hypothetical protein